MTEDEKRTVARRAYGEYAILDTCGRIWKQYRKERSIYTVFLDEIFGGRGDGRARLDKWDAYVAAAQPVQAAHPKPKPAPEPKPEPGSDGLGQLRRHQILEALRRPWPTRDPWSE